jgi:4-amino-4-deoxy-L-arabinose transferase-like glycosyltransferase
MTTRQALWVLITISALLRLTLAGSVGASNDEAYYSLFAVHRDWSYFDHPPMVALIASIGRAFTYLNAPAFALRLGFIGLFAGSTLVMDRLAARFYGPSVGVLAAFALNVTGYFGVVVGTCCLPDGPLLFFWLLTLERLAAALQSADGVRPWVEVGLAWGGALLSKYHAVFLPAGALLYVALEPSERGWLRRRGPYLAIIVGLACFSPVLWWNATHAWASFAFQGRRAFGQPGFRPAALAVALGGQAAYVFPWIWITTMVIAARRAIHWRDADRAGERFLLCQAVWPLTIFTAVACFRPVLPHWSLVGFLSLLPLLGNNWSIRLKTDPGRMRSRLVVMGVVPVVLTWATAEHARTGFLQQGGRGSIGLVATADDPTLDLFGWDQAARELKERGLLGLPNTFLFTGNWFHSGQLAFAIQNASPVLCYHPHDARSFAFWSQPTEWIGQSGILVAIDDRSIEPACYDRWFAQIESIGEFPIIRAGVSVHKVRLFRCAGQLKAFPFDDSNSSVPRSRVAAGRTIAHGTRR